MLPFNVPIPFTGSEICKSHCLSNSLFSTVNLSKRLSLLEERYFSSEFKPPSAFLISSGVPCAGFSIDINFIKIINKLIATFAT